MAVRKVDSRAIVLVIIVLSIRGFIYRLQSSEPRNGSLWDGENAIHLQERLNHTIYYNFKVRAKAFIGGPHVTLTTIADTNFLHHIVPMVQRWNGPISLCVFAPGDHFDLAVRQIQWLVSCSNTSLVHDWVSFHFVFPKALGPKKIHKWNNIPKNGEDLCLTYDVPEGETTNSVTYRQSWDLEFPINLLRNIAIEGIVQERDQSNLMSSNQFVFPCDIEMIPSPNLATKFGALIKRMDLFDREQRVAFLLPEFEIKEGEALPVNKTTLLHEMRRTKNVVMFHQKTTGMLHVIPSMADWIATPERDDSNLELLPKLEGPIPGRWEPLFIIRKDIMPQFDERLTWETKSDKILLMIKMCFLGIQFRTLNNAFSSHEGIKTASGLFQNQPSKGSTRLVGQILNEYEALFGENGRIRCRESNSKQLQDQRTALRKTLASRS